ncbi:MAG: oxidoreductase, partial [Bacteroidia bacterium]|nr:oxidoreductase [Bacteroidia bacterium]
THCRFALNNNCDAICEKPLVLNPWNLEYLQNAESKSTKNIYNILQLRLHPTIVALKNEVESNPDKTYDVDLNYVTSRGPWYHISWKGEPSKSGGITSNIGVHFFDMLLWIFGECQQNIVHAHTSKYAGGFLQLTRANIRWFLSVDAADLPASSVSENHRTHRSLVIDNKLLEFSDGFEDLHTKSYKQIIDGHGFTTDDVAPVIHLNHKIRTAEVKGLTGDYHPQLRQK